MSVIVRPYKRGGWEVDISLEQYDGTKVRVRKKAPVSSKSGSMRWGQARERELLLSRPKKPRKEIPNLEEFSKKFLDGYARANRQKPSGIAAKETILRVHLIPLFGIKQLDCITTLDIQVLKGNLQGKAVKTVNNVLSTLNTMLKVAVEWDVIEEMPCTIRLLKVSQKEAEFYDFDEYDRLIKAAQRIDEQALLVVFLGGDAGLRCGEMMALEWTDIGFSKRQLKILRSDWKGHVTLPKGGRPRVVPLTKRLTSALQAHRHLRSPRVLCMDDGTPLTQKVVRGLILKACRLAQLPHKGVHALRHSFCSHLSMRGAPARAIQELAGHKDLSTTQRYMHLSPAAVEAAIRLLEMPSSDQNFTNCFGDILETGTPSKANSNH